MGLRRRVSDTLPPAPLRGFPPEGGPHLWAGGAGPSVCLAWGHFAPDASLVHFAGACALALAPLCWRRV
jgi:hypothetical protein